jgi:hypothetical protein
LESGTNGSCGWTPADTSSIQWTIDTVQVMQILSMNIWRIPARSTWTSVMRVPPTHPQDRHFVFAT